LALRFLNGSVDWILKQIRLGANLLTYTITQTAFRYCVIFVEK